MSKEVIIACDFNSQEKTLEFLQQFKDEKPYVKIGMEVFYGNGPEIVRQIKQQGHQIFLDLKLHDIPNTVYHAMSMLAQLDVDMVNVHARRITYTKVYAGNSCTIRIKCENGRL